MVGLLLLTVANPARARLLHTAPDLGLVTMMTLTSDIREATNLRQRNTMPTITSHLNNLLAAVVRRLTRIRQMLHLANLVSDRRSLLPPHLCLHHMLHASRHKCRLMALAERRLFLDHHLL